MTTLSARDARQMLRFVAEAQSVQGDEPFTGDFLVELGRLVEADWVTYCELDRVRRRLLLNVQRTGDAEESDSDVPEEVFWEIVVNEHPVCVQHQRGLFSALKVSDFFTPSQFRQTRLYNEWFRPFRAEHEMSVPIPSPLWHTKTFLFDRAPGPDFSERDRQILDVLRPHLASIWRAARARRALRSALAELDEADAAGSRGVVLLTSVDDVEFASAPALRLIEEFFGAKAGPLLPQELSRWLESGAAAPLTRRKGRTELTVERSGDTLLLQERYVESDLTAREREVLAWVARGKTNPEIAELLWLSPGTVRKHLENVYAKLGVNTRTAAATRFLALLEADAS
jgi:DNA-binding CsgD family transcriptional regulator